MSITYKDLVTHAEQLAKMETEVAWRDSIARAYYAAFHQARGASINCPEPSPGIYGTHEKLQSRFVRQGTSDAKTIAQALRAMKRERGACDYELAHSFKQTAALNQLQAYRALSRRIVAFEMSNNSKKEA